MLHAKTLFLFLVISVQWTICFSQTEKPLKLSQTDSLRQLLEEVHGKNKFPILLRIAEKSKFTDIELSLECIDQAKEWVNENEQNEDLFHYYSVLAGVQYFNAQFQESLLSVEKAQRIQLPEIDPYHYANLYFQKNANYNRLGENDKAQEANFKSLKIADSLQLGPQLVQAYNAIGNVYSDMDDYEKAEEYLLLAVAKAEEIESEERILMSKGNLSLLYGKMFEFEKAKKILLECIEINEANGAKRNLGINYNNLALIYHGQENYELSLQYLKKALLVAEEVKNQFSIANRTCNVGELYMQLNNYKLAQEYLENGIEKAKEIKNKEIQKYGLATLVDLFERKAQYDKALAYHKQYASLSDSLLNEKRIKVVAEIQEKYDAEKKEKEIKNLSGENLEAKKKLKLFSNLIYWLCGSLLAFAAFFYFIRQNLKKNNIIQKKNLKIASDKIAILEQNEEITKLSSLIKGQEYERQRLAKELHDGLGGLLAISHSKLANLNSIDENPSEAIEESKNLVGDAYDQVRQISHNLMPLDLEKFGLVITLENMISLLNNQNAINIDFRTYQFNLTLNNDLGLNIYRIVQEAITNILKYAEAKNVLIELIQHEQQISLTIEDDGKGFDPKNISSGIGIQNMRNRSEILNGTFSIESQPEEGTSISIQIPIAEKGFMQDQT